MDFVHGRCMGPNGVLNGRWVPRLLPRLVIVSCSGSSVGTNRKWPMAMWIVTVPPPLRPRPHEADHGDSRLGVIKREWSILMSFA